MTPADRARMERAAQVIETLTKERDEARRAYESVADALGMAEYPEGQGGLHVATPQELVRYVREVQDSRDRYQNERDEARRVARALARKSDICGCEREGCFDCMEHAGIRAIALDYPEVKP